MKKTQRVIKLLPATLDELAALMQSDKHVINATLNNLRLTGRVKRSDRYGMRAYKTGRKPALWVRT